LAHFYDGWSRWQNLLPLAVLMTSLFGSPHCVAMCGGIIVSVTNSFKKALLYHLGRLLGYGVLGAIAGILGRGVFHVTLFMAIPKVATTIFAVGFIYMGLQIYHGRVIYLFRLSPKFLSRLHGISRQGPWAAGLLSSFLPCGWLHTFVLGASATQSPWQGAIYLFFFWLGTLPLLSLVPFAAAHVARPVSRFSPKVSGCLLIGMGIISLSLKWVPHENNTSCHIQAENPIRME